MCKATRTKAIVEPVVGGPLNLYDGKIVGKFELLEADKKIVQDWKMSEWKEFSKVTIELIDYADEEECEMKLKQINIPEDVNKIDLKNGWINQIFRPMSILCGYPILNQD